MPDNTLPMMTCFGKFGPIEMGGMFSVVKVREGLDRNDYKDPGWYRHPAGTVAHEFKGSAPAAPNRQGAVNPERGNIEFTVIKPRMTSHN
jgi:manganese oxidase